MKKCSEETHTLRAHYFYLQTEFGEDRCTQFRVIAVTDPQTHTHPHTHTPTNKQTGPITIHCAAASLARSVMNRGRTWNSKQRVHVHKTNITAYLAETQRRQYVSRMYKYLYRGYTRCDDAHGHGKGDAVIIIMI